MKKNFIYLLLAQFLFMLSCFFVGQAFAVKASFKVTGTGGAPIPTSYSAADAKSLVISSQRYLTEVCVWNDTASLIAFSTVGTATVAPSSSAKEIYVASSTGACEPAPLGDAVYIRSASGSTITALDVWGYAK